MMCMRRLNACCASALLLSCATLVGADFDEAHSRDDAEGMAGRQGGATYASPEPGENGEGGWAPNGGSGGASAGSESSDTPNVPEAGAIGAGGDTGGATWGGNAGQPAVDCPEGLRFQHVAQLPPPGNGSPSAQTLASGLARIDRVEPEPACQGALLAEQLFLTIDCAVDAHSRLVFGAALSGGSASEPDSSLTYSVRSELDVGEHFALASFSVNPFTWSTLRLPLEARDPEPGELLTAITHRGDGLARAARLTLDSKTFNQHGAPVDPPADMSAVFNSAGRLIGFCSFDECARPGACYSVASLLESSPLLRTLYAMRNALVADATGDGRADLIAVDQKGVGLRRSDGSQLEPVEFWVGVPYYGSRQNLLADFDGDGLADLAVVNDEDVAVRSSTGESFNAQRYWLRASPFFGDLGTRAGDVDGDELADLVILEAGRISVRRSNGNGFGDVELWGSDVPGPVGFELADVNADARTDLVLVYPNRIEVGLSTGTSFEARETWLWAQTPGSGYFFADVNGDAATDAIRFDAEALEVFAADAKQFRRLEGAFSVRPPVGERASYFADVTGDGLADAIALDNNGVRVSLCTGSEFAPPQVWAMDPYWGGF